MTQAMEGETVIYADKKGNPTSLDKAVSVEVQRPEGLHTVMVRDDDEENPPKDPFA